ncbi:MAG: aminotransferase class III-fold pyridoxal phosphate-dependent enzyme [bacterium]
MQNLKILDETYIAHTYARFPVELVSGQGSLVYDAAGKRYIDMGSGIGVTAFGIADEAWKTAVIRQLSALQHVSNLYYTEPCVQLAKLLCEKTGMARVFFNNSGAEANETMIKVARKYGAETLGPEYYTIVTLENSFHGRTLTTLAATGQESFHRLFTPLTPGFVHAKANDLEGVKRAALEHKACAVMLECVQGEGGVIALEESFVRGVAEFCAANGLLLLIDEVQTGNGRTGALYAWMRYGVKPDVFTTAKGLGGGLPIGAAVLGERVKDIFAPGDNGSTFGGNPVASAGAVSVLSRIDEALLREVREKSDYIFSALTGAPGVESVTGLGLMIGVKTARPAREVVLRCLEDGVLCLTAKDKVRLLPALNIPFAELAEAVAVLRKNAE